MRGGHHSLEPHDVCEVRKAIPGQDLGDLTLAAIAGAHISTAAATAMIGRPIQHSETGGQFASVPSKSIVA